VCAAGLLGVLLAALPAAAEATGQVRGKARLEVEGVTLEAVSPVVVYLEPPAGTAAPAAPGRPVTVRQRYAEFRPGFLVVSVGQTVRMPNDDTILHNVFSYSKPNAFDLGLYPAGELREVTFRHPGLVRVYCSIHESMSGTIWVAPAPFHAVVRPDGSFELTDVPAGRWRLRTWSEKLPETSREIAVEAGKTLSLELPLGGGAP
jgi:plastocyanin